MVQRYIKELDIEHTGSYTTDTELVNFNDMHSVKQYDRVHSQGKVLIKTIAWNFISLRSKLSEFATYDKTF